MDLSALHTTSDLESLRSLALEIIESRDAEIQAHRRENHYKQTKIDALTAEIARLRRVQFAARSEAMNPEQRNLFDEAIAADIAAVETELEALQSPAVRSTRAAPKRAPLPENLPRIEIRHEPESCDCGQCGSALTLIGEHVSEKLDCKPLEFFVRRDVHPQYACRTCETITAVPVAPAIIDRGIAAPGLLAQVLVSKYLDHAPLYRQESIFLRSGVSIPRSTLAEWVGVCGVRLQPLVDALHTELLTSPVLHADETPVSLLDPGAGKTRRAYLFAYRSPGENPIVVFDFCQSRSGKHAARFLGDYRGALMVDDFAGYKALFTEGITELGCMAHARRKYFDLHKANQSTQALEALNRIAALYKIEATAKDLDDTARHHYRLTHAKPLLDDFHRWLITLRQTVLGGSGLAKAIDYSLKRWSALTRYLDDGRYPIDNNPIENAIRPIALGRKNWLFVGSPSAGTRAAAIMSLLATAKANGQEPHAWLLDVLTRLPTTRDRDIEQLLPHRWQAPTAH